jgi:Ran GTPase-activating protein (RanGAP) involved in mRNA processing and transport
MALLNLPTPIALHRLPGVCPLLEVLDLSYNIWLSSTSRNAPKILERVEWCRWNCLRVLGLRDCLISDEMLQKLNKGRWDDVQVVERLNL